MKEQKAKGIALCALFFIIYGSIMFFPPVIFFVVFFFTVLIYPIGSIVQKFNAALSGVFPPGFASKAIVWGFIFPTIHILIGIGLLGLKRWALKLLFLIIPIYLVYMVYHIFKLQNLINDLIHSLIYLVIFLYFVKEPVRKHFK